jgi:hypothetical protein
MSNTYATCSIIAKEALPILENMLTFASAANRDWEDEFTGNMARGYAPGATINIKKPPRYTYRAGRVAVPQATTEGTVPLTVSQGGCDLYFTSAERTLSLTKLEAKIQAAMAPVANEIDRQGLQLAHYSTFNCIGTPGTLPNTQALALQAVLAANQRLDEMGAPRKDGNRAFIMNPALNAAAVQGFAGMFNAQSTLSKQFSSGMMVDSLGLSYAMDQNVDVHTNGSQAVTGTNINGAGQTGSSITVVGLAGNITKGTVITLPGVFAVNPQSRTSTGTLAQFVVTADVAAAATQIPISPAIVTSGAFQNVTASPTTGSPFTIFGTASSAYNTNIAFHKDAFTLAMVPMWAPPGGKGVIDVAQESYKGFTIKVTEYYDGVNDTANIRLDVLFGWASPYPELSVKYAT